MIKARASISGSACIPRNGRNHTHLEKTSSMLAMSSSPRGQHCFFARGHQTRPIKTILAKHISVLRQEYKFEESRSRM